MAEQNFTGLDWEDVRIFVALARYGSLSAAARALSLTHATVSRRMRSLEAVLGEALVERRPDGYVLTSAGTHFLVPANEMEAAAAKLIRGGPDNTPKGLVRVNAPPPPVLRRVFWLRGSHNLPYRIHRWTSIRQQACAT